MRSARLRAAMLGAWAVTLLAAVPGIATDVHVGINIGPPPVVIESPPRLVVVPGSPVTYAPDLPYGYYFYDGRYWLFHDDRWYSGPGYNGPWTVVAVERVPREIVVVRTKVKHVKGPGHPGHGRGHGRHGGHKHG